MVNRWRMIFLVPLICGLWVASAAALNLQAVADRDRIGLGESLQLQLRLDGSPDAEPDFSPLEQNWEILSRSQSSQMQIINSSFKRSIVYSLTLMPRGEGSLTIPPLCFGPDCSLPIPIVVLPRSALAGSASEPLLLESEISQEKIVSQGQLLLKVRLLRRVDLLEGQLSEPQPRGVAALVKKLGADRSYELRRDGQLYQVIERAYAIFPQGSGQMLIPALQFDGTIAAGNSRSYPFARQGQRVRRTSQPLQVEVTPLPSDLGRRAWIPAIGVELQDDWQQQPPQLVVGEPATRTLRLSAGGVLSAQLPELKPAVPAGFKTYPDQPSREDQLDSSGIRGVMEQKIALVPTRPGRYRLPAVELDWWDLTTGQWRTAQLAALDVEVAPAAGTEAQKPSMIPGASLQSAATDPAATESQPSVPVATAPPEVASQSSNSGIWSWVSLGLACGWLLTLFFMFSRWRRLAPTVREETTSDSQLSEKNARRAVVQAARSHDPQATRRTLLALSSTLWPATQDNAYEQLRKAADPPLRKELENLDLCLYGRSDLVWDGRGLVDCLAAWRVPAAEKVSSELPALYPDQPA